MQSQWKRPKDADKAARAQAVKNLADPFPIAARKFLAFQPRGRPCRPILPVRRIAGSVRYLPSEKEQNSRALISKSSPRITHESAEDLCHGLVCEPQHSLRRSTTGSPIPSALHYPLRGVGVVQMRARQGCGRDGMRRRLQCPDQWALPGFKTFRVALVTGARPADRRRFTTGRAQRIFMGVAASVPVRNAAGLTSAGRGEEHLFPCGAHGARRRSGCCRRSVAKRHCFFPVLSLPGIVADRGTATATWAATARGPQGRPFPPCEIASGPRRRLHTGVGPGPEQRRLSDTWDAGPP